MQEKTRINIPSPTMDEEAKKKDFVDMICGSGEERIMFR